MTSSPERSLITFLRTRNTTRVQTERFIPTLKQARTERYDRETDRLTNMVRRSREAA